MSTRIIDELQAVRIAKEKAGTYDDIYILCELGGDNNVINTRTGRRARSWSAIAIGVHYQVIKTVCDFAGSFEGGMRKFKTGRATPEAYIRRWRKALAVASEMGTGDLCLSLRIRFSNDEKSNGAKYYYDELIKSGAAPVVELRYGEQGEVFSFSSGELVTWLKGVHGHAWRNVEVSGPGTI